MTQRCAGRQGYREPECAFLKLQGPARPEASAGDAAGTPRVGEPAGSPRAAGGAATAGECAPAGGMLCLALHAPRRRQLEVWHVASGRRLGAVRLQGAARLMQLSRPVRKSVDDGDVGLGAGEEGEEGEDASAGCSGGLTRVRSNAAGEAGADDAGGIAECVIVDAAGNVSVVRVVRGGGE
jgi:hypothetical protein